MKRSTFIQQILNNSVTRKIKEGLNKILKQKEIVTPDSNENFHTTFKSCSQICVDYKTVQRNLLILKKMRYRALQFIKLYKKNNVASL